ncbi:unnamed protein product [Rotaria sp. Silwood1]|nr:unnamed protein product [Rotaria sp. Silwood1]
MQNQRYLINATMNDVYKQNKTIEQDQYLLYGSDFIPSREMPLNLFLSSTISLIEFKLIFHKLQANVTVICDEQESSIVFQCEPKMTIGRVQEIACHLWKLNKQLIVAKNP